LRVRDTVTLRGVRDAWLLVPAVMHDSQAMPALFDQARDRVGLGDGAVHNSSQSLVPATHNVVVYVPP